MSIGNINNRESGLSVRNKLNEIINEINALTSTLGITTGATFNDNIIYFDTNKQNNAYNVNISGLGPSSNITDYGFTVITPSATTATTINTNITLSYPSGTTVTYPDPLIIGDNGSVSVPNEITLIITSGTT